MNSISQTTQRYLLGMAVTCFFIGYNMTWQKTEILYSPISVIALLCLAFPVYIGTCKIYGIKQSTILWISIGLFGIGIETIGIKTGFPYGTFLYTNPLGGLIFGYAPWTLVLAWPPLVIGTWSIIRSFSSTPLRRVILGTILLTCFDLVMDPGAVQLGFWSFLHEGIYYHVPYTNFLGWLLSSTISLLIIEKNKDFTQKHIPSTITTLGLIFSIALWTGVAAGHKNITPLCIGIILFLWIYNQDRTATFSVNKSAIPSSSA